ncbi:hypothetical protein C8Q78DRAFT_769544 [Trametes maxima]|nr:hypothetical protein C8Q78DRAFT_769544 [Trametes maxima]
MSVTSTLAGDLHRRAYRRERNGGRSNQSQRVSHLASPPTPAPQGQLPPNPVPYYYNAPLSASPPTPAPDAMHEQLHGSSPPLQVSQNASSHMSSSPALQRQSGLATQARQLAQDARALAHESQLAVGGTRLFVDRAHSLARQADALVARAQQAAAQWLVSDAHLLAQQFRRVAQEALFPSFPSREHWTGAQIAEFVVRQVSLLADQAQLLAERASSMNSIAPEDQFRTPDPTTNGSYWQWQMAKKAIELSQLQNMATM